MGAAGPVDQKGPAQGAHHLQPRHLRGQLGPAGPWIFVSMKADTILGYAKVQLTGVQVQRM